MARVSIIIFIGEKLKHIVLELYFHSIKQTLRGLLIYYLLIIYLLGAQLVLLVIFT